MKVLSVLLQQRKSKHCYFIKTIYSTKCLSLGYKWPVPCRHRFSLHTRAEFALAQRAFWFKRKVSPQSRAATAGPEGTRCLLFPTDRCDPKHTETSVWLSTRSVGLRTRITAPLSLWLLGESVTSWFPPKSGNCLIRADWSLCHLGLKRSSLPYQYSACAVCFV